MIYRLLGSGLILLSILVLPYWIYLPVLFLGVAFFPLFWEGIWLAFLIDVFYGSGIENFSDIFSSFAFYVLIILIISLPLKSRLRSHA